MNYSNTKKICKCVQIVNIGLIDSNWSQTCRCVFLGQDIHSCGTEVAVSVGLCAVQDLLELFVSRLLSFHSHLQWKHNCCNFTTRRTVRHTLLCFHVDQENVSSFCSLIPLRWWSLSPSASLLYSSPGSSWCRPTPPSPSPLTWTRT